MRNGRSIRLWALLLLVTVTVSGCDGCRKALRGKYFDSLETIGLEKRDMLVKRVDRARDAQEDAQEQFEDALEQFQAMVGHDGGELEAMYDRLKGEFEDAEARAERVRDKIKMVETVAEALFDEWRAEIAVFDNASYKRQSEQALRATETRYTELLRTMQRASGSMDPVLAKLRDQVLYLKHNLNAQALGSLSREADLLQAEVGRLLQDMQASIAEADRFIAEMTEEA